MGIEVYFILLFLCIPVFFLWQWLFKKTIKAERVRKFATWGATLVSTPLLYVGFMLILISIITYYPHRTFSRERWLADEEKRYELSDNIIKSKMLIGKTKADVKAILGDGGLSESSSWTYELGYRPQLFNIDPDYLIVKFKNGVVINVYQHNS